MTPTKVTIGCTINLQNFENLKIEVEGPTAEGLAAGLDEILAQIGRADPHATAAIDSYRRRVLGIPGMSTPAVRVPGPTPQKSSTIVEHTGPASSSSVDMSRQPPVQMSYTRNAGDPNTCGKCGASSRDNPQPKIAFLDGVYQCVACYKAGKDLHVPSSGLDCGATVFTEPAPAAASPKAVPKPPAKMPAPAATGAVCAHCGKPISEAERKTALLIVGEPRCKACIQKTDSAGKVRG